MVGEAVNLLKEMIDLPFTIDKPNMVVQMPDGAYRLFLFNDHEIKYHRAFVKMKEGEMKDAKIVSKFPILPPRFMDEATGLLHHAYNGEDIVKKGFEVKIQPGGVTIVDVYL